MSRPTLKYLLFNDLKRPLYVDENGYVLEGNSATYKKSDGELAALQDDPEGWREALVKYARNDRYHGIFRSYSSTVRFVGDGARILRNRMWTSGVEGVVYMGILRLDLLSLPYTYRAEYLSELNMAKYSETVDGVSVEALEGGLSKLLKAYETTTYELPLDGDAKSVRLDGMLIGQKINYLVPGIDIPDPAPRNLLVPITLMGADSVSGTDVLYSTQSFEALPQGNPHDFAQGWLQDSPNWFYKTEGARTVHIQGAVKTRQGAGGGDYIGVQIYGTVGKTFYYETYLEGEGERAASIDITVTLPAGETLYLLMGHPFTKGFSLLESDISVSFDYRFRATNVQGFYLRDALEKLVRKLSNGKYGARSSWLSQKNDIILSSGDAVRGLKNPSVKISLSDLFRILSFWSVGLGIEGDTLVVEPISYFYQSSVILDLGEVSGARIDVAEEKLFTTLKVGAEEKELDQANGKYAFVQPQQWTTPATRTPREWDMTLPALCDPFALEHLRITTFGQDTTASSGDNQAVLLHVTPDPSFVTSVSISHFALGTILFNRIEFPDLSLETRMAAGVIFTLQGTSLNAGPFTVLDVAQSAGKLSVFVKEAVQNEIVSAVTVRTSGHTLYRDPSMVITGVPDPASVFNVLFRPTSAIRNNGALIRSSLDGLDTGVLKLSSALRNKELTTTVAGVTIREKDDIQVGALAPRLYRPFLLKFRTSAPLNALQLLKTNPYGKVQFRWNGQVWRGYLVDGGQRLADSGEQDWSLLSAPENDLSKFNQS